MLKFQRQESSLRGEFEFFVFVFEKWVLTVTPFGRNQSFSEALITLSLNRETFPLNIVRNSIRELVEKIRGIG